MQLSDFDYHLPQELIARYPLSSRSDSRLMHVNQGEIKHLIFKEMLALLNPGDLLIFNDTKVIPARLFGKKKTGGLVEFLLERLLTDKTILVQLRASKAPKMGDSIFLNDDIELKVIARANQFFELELQHSSENILTLIEKMGEIPLPPYMHRKPENIDKERYQTIYAAQKGSVAAPTAGFHFDHALLSELRAKKIEFGFITLHIGAGTFLPVRTENILEHKMHAEFVTISDEVCDQIKAAKKAGNRVIAVGTTTLRALESAVDAEGHVQAFNNDTSIFIYPGYQFKSADALITNLHLPCSTLLMLVCAFAGYEAVMEAYKLAVANEYRFYSYGDAMFLEFKS